MDVLDNISKLLGEDLKWTVRSGAKVRIAASSFSNPRFILRYSATHRQEHNKVYRLDALDAFNQKLVKKIGVRGISVKGQAGASAYPHLQSIEVSADEPPQA